MDENIVLTYDSYCLTIGVLSFFFFSPFLFLSFLSIKSFLFALLIAFASKFLCFYIMGSIGNFFTVQKMYSILWITLGQKLTKNIFCAILKT